VRFLIAHVFYPIRSLSDTTLSTWLGLLQPCKLGVCDAASELPWFKDVISELQNDLCISHRFLCDVFLGSEVGNQWLQRWRKMRCVLAVAT